MQNLIIKWDWGDSFLKFGHSDGRYSFLTYKVAEFIEEHCGFTPEINEWGCHNTVITDLICQNTEKSVLFFNENGSDSWLPKIKNKITQLNQNYDVRFGYITPRIFLPGELIDRLDREFSGEECVDLTQEWQ
jgi:hypothetical protein